MPKVKAIRNFSDGKISYLQGSIYEVDEQTATKYPPYFCRVFEPTKQIKPPTPPVVETAVKTQPVNAETATKPRGRPAANKPNGDA